jgi:DNA-binding NarL/FixJ family response regulator
LVIFVGYSAATPNPTAPPVPDRRSIYVAEDHEAIRELLCQHPWVTETFELAGHSGFGSVTARECLEKRPDLLLLDLKLADSSGFEVMRGLGEAGVMTRVLVFSSSSDVATIQRVLALGGRGFVEKTAPFQTLQRAMAAVAEGHLFLTDSALQHLQAVTGGGVTAAAAGKPGKALTGREVQVLKLVAHGSSNKEVAEVLRLSVRTVENHRHSLMKKLGARNAADLARGAFERGLIRT